VSTTVFGATILGAFVAIIAIERRPGHADTAITKIPDGARIAVTALTGNVLVGTAALGQADIHGAGIVVIAIQIAVPLANAIGTDVSGGAGVLVVTPLLVGSKIASDSWYASIIRTQITVVADHEGTGLAIASTAFVPLGADISVITRDGIVVVITTNHRNTEIISTGIVIATIRLSHPNTIPSAADIPQRTRVTVITGGIALGMRAPHQRQTSIQSTWIRVVAAHDLSTHTIAIAAGIPQRTQIGIVTRSRIGLVKATLVGITEIVGTDVSVIAVLIPGGLTGSVYATFTCCAGITVITSAGFRIVHATQVAVATIDGAGIAVITTSHRRTHTLSLDTKISNSTRVPIITRPLIEGKLAPGFTITEVISTWIAVVAGHRGAHTLAATAMIRDGARITVVTSALIEEFV
jgi:hypothetical protein